MIPSPENLAALRFTLGKTQGEMADLCGYPWTNNKINGETKPMPASAYWRKLTSTDKHQRQMSHEAFFHLAAHLALPTACAEIDKLIAAGSHPFTAMLKSDEHSALSRLYKNQSQQLVFYAFAHAHLSAKDIIKIAKKMQEICKMNA